VPTRKAIWNAVAKEEGNRGSGWGGTPPLAVVKLSTVREISAANLQRHSLDRRRGAGDPAKERCVLLSSEKIRSCAREEKKREVCRPSPGKCTNMRGPAQNKT